MVAGCGTHQRQQRNRHTTPGRIDQRRHTTPSASTNGGMGLMVLSQQRAHEVIYADGRRCVLESRVGAGYVIADIILTFLIGVIVDAATEKWKSLDESSCPGVIVD